MNELQDDPGSRGIMTVQIRNYSQRDWDAICTVHDAARPDELVGSCDPRAFLPLAQDPESEDLRKSRILVADYDGQVVGFAAVKESYLSFLYIHPDFYRLGIGKKLLKASLEVASGQPWTIVLSGNEAAISLYQAEGFAEVARFESDNEGYPVTCLRMVRQSG